MAGGMPGGGMCGRPGGGMCGRGHAWQGDMHGRCVCGRGACVAGGMHGTHATPLPDTVRYSWSMLGQYASYWDAFLSERMSQTPF